MKNKEKLSAAFFVALLVMYAFTGCSKSNQASESVINTKEKDSKEKINVVATIFPQYDFLRQIAGDHINLTMLLTPGSESHSFEPTPQNILAVQNSDLFAYVGGDSDAWVEDILDSMNQDGMKIVTLIDCVDLVEEETVEGMEPEDDDEGDSNEPEMDEHVWTSPRNAILIVQKLSDALCEIDPVNADDYKENTINYIEQLKNLDGQFQEVVDNAARTEIVVGDRFPFRYFVDAYGLTYYAAFPGCSTETGASAATVSFLIDKVKEDNIPVVFHIELTNEQMCDSICEATGAKSELLNAVHNVSKDDFNAGVTYLELMEHNVLVLKEALN